jgi:hypothetical protein
MNALCRAYDNIDDAQRAVEALLSAGVAGDDVRLLMGAEIHDARREAAGGFAGPVASRDRVGAYAGEARRRETPPRGSFAGHSDGLEGVFANADRDVVLTYSDGREHSRVAGHRHLKRLLLEAGLGDDAAESDVRALHEGRVLVLVTTDAMSMGEAAALVDAAV